MSSSDSPAGDEKKILRPEDSNDQHAKRLGAWKLPKYKSPPDVLNPRRLSANPKARDHDYCGIAVLRVRADSEPASGGRSCTTSGLRMEWIKNLVERLEVEQARRDRRRMVGVIFDTTMSGMPTSQQQFDMLKAYYETNTTRLLWDGWEDTVVQYLNPRINHETIRLTAIADDLFWHLHDHNHIVFPTLTFLTNPMDYVRIPAWSARREKTLAILDHGIDTMKHPRQILMATAMRSGAYTQPFLAAITAKMNRQFTVFGYKSLGGRLVPYDAIRRISLEIVRRVDMDHGAYYKDERLSDKRLRSTAETIRCKRFHNLQGMLDSEVVSLAYIAHKLDYPPTLAMSVGKMLVRDAKMNLFRKGRVIPFNEEHARKLIREFSSRSGEAWKAIVALTAEKDTRRLLQRAARRYAPAVPESWILEALSASEPREVNAAHEPLGSVFRKYVSKVRQELQEIGENAEGILEGYVDYLSSHLLRFEEQERDLKPRKRPRCLVPPVLTFDEYGARTRLNVAKSYPLIEMSAQLELPRNIGVTESDQLVDEAGQPLELDLASFGDDGSGEHYPMLPPAWSGDDDPATI